MQNSILRKMFSVGLGLSSLLTLAHASDDLGCTIAGPANASIRIEEFVDFECHFCSVGANTIEQVLKDYPGQIRLVYRNMPLAIHNNAVVAAKIFSAACLQDSSLARTFQSQIFANQVELRNRGQSYLFELAGKIGLNVAQIKIDMVGSKVAKMLADDQQVAKLHSVTGTPSFLIGSELVTGAIPYKEIKAIVDRQLSK